MSAKRHPTAVRPELAGALQQGLYSIGDAAISSGVSSKMIRYYESIDLLPAPVRTAANYRVYSQDDINQLRFIRRARDLGFSMKQIAQLVSLWQSDQRSSADVKALALTHVGEMDQRIREMQEMRDALMNLAERCHGDDDPACPILDSLGEPLNDSMACQLSTSHAKLPL